VTINGFKEIAPGDSFDCRFPACRGFYLKRENTGVLEAIKISESAHYLEMKHKAEES
jgi:hypothetical protein